MRHRPVGALRRIANHEHVLSNLTSGFLADWTRVSPPVAVLRVLRASRILRMGDVRRQLMRNPAYQGHISAVARDDAVFFLSHRHYLAIGLTPRQRATAALHHYSHEVDAFDGRYVDAVYRGAGLVVWRREVDEGVFDIRVLPGNDVLYEGGVSLVAFFNGVRIAVLSYANVPSSILLPAYVPSEDEAPLESTLQFVTRKQLTWDHSYQKAFNKAFDRSTLAHFTFAALAAVAQAQGARRVLAIAPRVQPSCSPAVEKQFEAAYTEFWESLGGKPAGAFGFVIDVPMRMKPLDELEAKARKRALARRKHVHAVYESTLDVMHQHLLYPAPRVAAAPDVEVQTPAVPGGESDAQQAAWVR